MAAVQHVPVRVDLAAYRRAADEAARAGRILELIDGELVEKMPSFVPSTVALTIGAYLRLYSKEHDLGYVTGADGGYVLDEGNVFIPDVGFITRARLPEPPAREAPVPPDLAVEVRSPSDTVRELRRKAEKYLAAGTRLVWLVFPEARRVEVYDGEADVVTLGEEDTLTGGALLPGFTLPVRNIFT
jgi:Uma2 family endonuclease